LVQARDERRSILIVEDDALLRELFAVALEGRGFEVETAATAADARRIFARLDPDGVVLDVDLGPGPNGFDLALVLRKLSPQVAIVFLTGMSDPRIAGAKSSALPKGVAYLRKSALNDVETLVQTVDQALRGEVTAGYRHDLEQSRPLGNLTTKQLEVLRLISAGLTNKQIAEQRGVSVKAVEDLVRRTLASLGLDSSAAGNARTSLVRAYLHAATGFPKG
jgi:DNA-binding NarL/FixJ family response regulator